MAFCSYSTTLYPNGDYQYEIAVQIFSVKFFMKVLLDTNIIIHREAYKVSNLSIGQLYRWLDKLKYTKCVHPITQEELLSHVNSETVQSMKIKLESYNILKTIAPLNDKLKKIIDEIDKDQNDINDSYLLNELLQDRVDIFITEDKKIHHKASLLNIDNKVYKISEFVEESISQHPELSGYKILSIRKEFLGNIDVNDAFFDSFRNDYFEFDKWFNKKADEVAYVCYAKEILVGFLYLKFENIDENYKDIEPQFKPKRRLKIGTLKVALNGYRIGERFLKIVFDNALRFNVDEIYVTIFDKTPEQLLLIELLEEWGFNKFGYKTTKTGNEKVYFRDFSKNANRLEPQKTFPFISKQSNVFFVPIWPAYHTELLPDSILNTESPKDFIENEPHRNALSKVYISHSYERNLHKGDIIVFYRTGGYHAGVVTTIGIVDNVYTGIQSLDELINICRKKTFFNATELNKFWNRYPRFRPFVVEFLYAYSLPKRPNLAKLIELDIIKDVNSVPRGFEKISMESLLKILKQSESNESLIVD